MNWGSFDSFRENLQLKFWQFDNRWKRLATNGRKRSGVNAILRQLFACNLRPNASPDQIGSKRLLIEHLKGYRLM